MLLDISLQSSTQSSYAHHLHISRQKSFVKKGKNCLTLPSQPSLNPCSQLCPYRSHADSSMHYSSHASLYIVFYLEQNHFNPSDEKKHQLVFDLLHCSAFWKRIGIDVAHPGIGEKTLWCWSKLLLLQKIKENGSTRNAFISERIKHWNADLAGALLIPHLPPRPAVTGLKSH